jgi:hypothetical protein
LRGTFQKHSARHTRTPFDELPPGCRCRDARGLGRRRAQANSSGFCETSGRNQSASRAERKKPPASRVGIIAKV